MVTGKQLAGNGSQTVSHALEEWITDEPKPVEELLPLMVSVLEAIATEPQLCCLNPGKILVREDQSVQLSTHKSFEPNETFDLGNAKYTCPDFFGRVAPGVPDNANVYVAGFIFYELLLGRKLFDAQFRDVEKNGNLGWLTWHTDVTKRAASLHETNRYPAFVCKIIDRMIEKDPANRLADVNSIARELGTVSNATTAYTIVRTPSSAVASGIIVTTPSDRPRPWLANLGQQKLWISLWKKVAPKEPHLRQRSIEELERIFQDAETRFRKFGSIFNLSQSARRKARGYPL
jgi:serine/threonine protein kinase